MVNKPRLNIFLRIILYFTAVYILASILAIPFMMDISEKLNEFAASDFSITKIDTELQKTIFKRLQLPLGISSLAISIIFTCFIDRLPLKALGFNVPKSGIKTLLLQIVFSLFTGAFIIVAITVILLSFNFITIQELNFNTVTLGISSGIAFAFFYTLYFLQTIFRQNGTQSAIFITCLLAALIPISPNMLDSSNFQLLYLTNYILLTLLLVLLFLRVSNSWIVLFFSVGVHSSICVINSSAAFSNNNILSGGSLVESSVLFSISLLLIIALTIYVPIKRKSVKQTVAVTAIPDDDSEQTVFKTPKKTKNEEYKSPDEVFQTLTKSLKPNPTTDEPIDISSSNDFTADIVVEGRKYDWKPLLSEENDYDN